jgi:hypothetical protein
MRHYHVTLLTLEASVCSNSRATKQNQDKQNQRLLVKATWDCLMDSFIPTLEIRSIKSPPRARVANNVIEVGDQQAQVLGMAPRSAAFEAIHITGWNLSFLASIHRELWHISSILTTCLLPIACLPLIFNSVFPRFVSRHIARL